MAMSHSDIIQALSGSFGDAWVDTRELWEQLGVSFDNPGLLLLPLLGHTGLWTPAWQLDGNGILPDVWQVNRIRRAQQYPWVVAEWWITPHRLLPAGAAPRAFAGLADEALRLIARL